MDYTSLARNVLSTVGAFNWLNSMQTKYLPFKIGYILIEFFSSGVHKRGGHAQNSYRLQSQIYETKALLELLAAVFATTLCYWMCCRGMPSKGKLSAQTVFSIIVFTHVCTILVDGTLFYYSYRSEVDADVQEMAHWMVLVFAVVLYLAVVIRNRNISLQRCITDFQRYTEINFANMLEDQQRLRDSLQEEMMQIQAQIQAETTDAQDRTYGRGTERRHRLRTRAP